MKKSFLTKEYTVEPVQGTFNMKESRVFFSSKILELDDIIKIDENDIIWTEAIDRTQGLGVDNQNRSLDTYSLKTINHTLSYSSNQTDSQIRENPRWDINIDINTIIVEYLFAQLKKNKTFSGIANDKTSNNNIDLAIKQYITDNILPRIKLNTIDLYIKYYRIGELQENNVIALQNQNKFREDLITPIPLSGETTTQYSNRLLTYKQSLKVTNFQLITNASQTKATIAYKQVQSALSYKFDYYFDVIYQKA